MLAPGGALCVGILHPIMTSGLFVPGDEYGTFYMGEYLKTMRHVLDIERRDGGIFRFRVEHRPIEQYFRGSKRAGLVVTALARTSPERGARRRAPEFANHVRVPNFLHLLARTSTEPRGAGVADREEERVEPARSPSTATSVGGDPPVEQQHEIRCRRRHRDDRLRRFRH